MKNVTEKFKDNITTMGRQQVAFVYYENTILSSNDLNGINISYDGSILKSVMKKAVIDSNVEIPKNTEVNIKWGILEDDGYEFIDYGNYIVENVEKQEDTNSYTITCYDKLLHSMKSYKPFTADYPVSVREYLNRFCRFIGVEFENANDTFCNYDKLIPNELYVGADGSDIGYTYRDMLDELSQVTASCICINQNDKLEVRYINDTGIEIDENYIKDVNVTFGDKYGKVNSIVLARSADSDSVYLQDVESVNKNGLCELKIRDNQVMNFNDRSDFLPDLLEYLDGLEYYTNDYSSTGIMFFDLLDRYKVKIGDNRYSCIMLSDEINITQGLEEFIHSDRPEDSETDYKASSDTDKKINRASLLVNKNNLEIQGLIQQVGDRTFKETSLTQDVDSIESKVNSITDLTNTVSGYGGVIATGCVKGEIVELTIRGRAFDFLAPSDSLLPNDLLYPYGKDEEPYFLYFKNTRTEKDEEGKEHEIITITKFDLEPFGIDEPLRRLSNEVYDEFYYNSVQTEEEEKEGKPKGVLRRRVGVNEDGTLYQLPTTEITNIDITLDLLAGDNELTLSEYSNGAVILRYVQDNNITKLYGITADLESRIEQTDKSIELVVEEKVGKNDIIADLNIAIEDDQGIIRIDGNKIIINTDYFKIDEYGYLRATAGTIGKWNLSQDGILYGNSNVGDILYQSGLDTRNNNYLLYAGVDVSDGQSHLLSEANAYITKHGLIHAKWFEVNGESGYFYINFDSGNRAVDINKYGMNFYNDANRGLYGYMGHVDNAMEIRLNDALMFFIRDYLHRNSQFEEMMNFVRYNPDVPTGNREHYRHVMYLNASLYCVGNGADNVNNSMYVNNWEVLTKAPSDERMKEHIKISQDKALEKINKISIKEFDFKKDIGLKIAGKHVNNGFIAQEVKEIDDTLVTYEENNDRYAMDLLNLIALNTKAIQELSEENKKLKDKVQNLEERLAKLEKLLGNE